MVGFRNLVGTGIAPVSKKTAVKIICSPNYLRIRDGTADRSRFFF